MRGQMMTHPAHPGTSHNLPRGPYRLFADRHLIRVSLVWSSNRLIPGNSALDPFESPQSEIGNLLDIPPFNPYIGFAYQLACVVGGFRCELVIREGKPEAGQYWSDLS